MTYLASLRGSKNILQLVEVVKEKTKLAIVTELCTESLSQKLKKNLQTSQRRLGETEAIKILEDVLRGYLSMRADGLLHRDIKPANILFGMSGSAILGDLGFATRDEDL
jgi:serine/threonine protein kinase